MISEDYFRTRCKMERGKHIQRHQHRDRLMRELSALCTLAGFTMNRSHIGELEVLDEELGLITAGPMDDVLDALVAD